jgi:hypothetical protein
VRLLSLLLLVAPAACAVSPLPVEDVLQVETCGPALRSGAPPPTMREVAELRAHAEALLVDLDVAAAEAIARAAGRRCARVSTSRRQFE